LRAATPEPLPALADATDRAFALARHAGADGGPVLARQAGTALYNVASATAMAWEAAASHQPQRRILAAMVLAHRVLPRDPLAATAEDIPDVLLADTGAAG
jgi:acyl-CoA dehydrogenase